MFQTNVVEKIKTHILYSFSLFVYLFIYLFLENPTVYSVEKYCRTEQATDDNMGAHVNCMVGT